MKKVIICIQKMIQELNPLQSLGAVKYNYVIRHIIILSKRSILSHEYIYPINLYSTEYACIR